MPKNCKGPGFLLNVPMTIFAFNLGTPSFRGVALYFHSETERPFGKTEFPGMAVTMRTAAGPDVGNASKGTVTSINPSLQGPPRAKVPIPPAGPDPHNGRTFFLFGLGREGGRSFRPFCVFPDTNRRTKRLDSYQCRQLHAWSPRNTTFFSTIVFLGGQNRGPRKTGGAGLFSLEPR